VSELIALFHDPWAGLAQEPASPRHPVTLWRQATRFKANPRSAAYMRERAAEFFPAARFIDVAAEPRWADALAGASGVVLLYPDAIGMGFGAIERRVRRATRTDIHVVTGRRRGFVLDRATRRRLRLRRLLERSMIIECVAGALVLLLTPVLYGIDRARGRQ
jgi:hypothetical protein